MEGTAFAIPVLATDIGGVKEIINHKMAFGEKISSVSSQINTLALNVKKLRR